MEISPRTLGKIPNLTKQKIEMGWNHQLEYYKSKFTVGAFKVSLLKLQFDHGNLPIGNHIRCSLSPQGIFF